MVGVTSTWGGYFLKGAKRRAGLVSTKAFGHFSGRCSLISLISLVFGQVRQGAGLVDTALDVFVDPLAGLTDAVAATGHNALNPYSNPNATQL